MIELVPAVSWVVFRVAVPELSVAEPRSVVPFSNSTVPVGVPVPDAGVTVAVSATDCPETGVPETGLSVVVVDSRLVSTTSWPSVPPL